MQAYAIMPDITERIARLEEGEEHRDKRLDELHDDVRTILSDLTQIKERLYEQRGQSNVLRYIIGTAAMICSGVVGSIAQRWLGHS